MTSIEKILEKAAYVRLEEMPEKRNADERMYLLLGNLEGETKRELRDILDEALVERAQREAEIYLRGLKDGARIIKFLEV